MSSVLKKRLAELEKTIRSTASSNMRIIGTAIVATDDPALIGTNSTVNNTVTFYAATLAQAFAARIEWMDQQKNTICIVGVDDQHRQLERDNAEQVLQVLREEHVVEVEQPAELLDAVAQARAGGELDTKQLTTEQLLDLRKIKDALP